MNRRKVFLGGICLATLAACASPQSPRGFQVSQPQQDQGQIVIYRPSSALGAALRLPTTVNGSSIGFLANGAVLVQSVPPGEHFVQASTPSLDGLTSVTVRVAAGETAYVRGEAAFGWPTGRPRLVSVSASQGQSELSRM